MTSEILEEFKQDISQLVLVPSDGGKFEVSIDKDLVFSKKKEGRFPEYKEIQKEIKGRM